MAKSALNYQHLSSGIVDVLCKRGMTLTQIGEKLGVTKSYVSRVKAGTRSFTLDHLVKLERAIGEPVPWLVLRAVPLESLPPDLRPLYKSSMKLLAPDRPKKRRRKSAA